MVLPMSDQPLDHRTRHARVRWELVAQERAKGASWEDACKAAGLNGASGNTQRMASNEWIANRVRELQAPAVEETIITIKELARIFREQGTFDPTIFDGVNSLSDMKTKVDEATRRLLVKGWKYDRQGRFVLDLVDKDTALDRLARYLGLYNDRLKVEVTSFDDLLAKAERAAGLPPHDPADR